MPSKSCRTGRIEWGRDPSALAFVDVMLKDGAAAFFLIQPSQFKRHTREFPSRFAPLQHETLALPIPEGVFAETASNRPPALIYDIFLLAIGPPQQNQAFRSFSARPQYDFFNRGHGVCYLCFPQMGYIPRESFLSEFEIWIWGKDLLSVGCTRPKCGLRIDFDYNLDEYHSYGGLREVQWWPIDSWSGEQAFLHIAICQTVREVRRVWPSLNEKSHASQRRLFQNRCAACGKFFACDVAICPFDQTRLPGLEMK